MEKIKDEILKYRHEYKFLCAVKDMALLQARIEPLLKRDIHAGEAGMYQIRSVYFDDLANSYYMQNEAGTDPREKLRIRIYNGSSDKISLELKMKKRGMTRKESALLTKEQCELLLSGTPLPLDEASMQSYPPVLRKLCMLMVTRQLKPKVIVEYERVPYICREGNVRITLDRHIVSSGATDHFLDGEFLRRPIMPAGHHIMEVKYDEFLPSYIKSSLELGKLRQTTFSKYYLCRRYALGQHAML